MRSWIAGSTHSFISASLFQELEMDITPSRRLSLTTVDRDVSVETQVAEGVVITDLQGENQLRLPSLFTLKSIPVTESDFPTESELHKWEHLRELTLPKLKSSHVGLLLGSNAFLAMEPLEVIPSREGSPYAVKTRYGWTLGGLRSDPQVRSAGVKVCGTSLKSDEQLERMFTQLYNAEYEENLSSTKRGASVEDREWQKKVDSSIHSEDGHYVIGLPLASEELNLPNNRVQAEKN